MMCSVWIQAVPPMDHVIRAGAHVTHLGLVIRVTDSTVHLLIAQDMGHVTTSLVTQQLIIDMSQCGVGFLRPHIH